MKLETYEQAVEIKKRIKALQQARDTMTTLIDAHSNQLDMIDDNDAAAAVNLAYSDTRSGLEARIADLEREFDAL